jgi:hypothetical protein
MPSVSFIRNVLEKEKSLAPTGKRKTISQLSIPHSNVFTDYATQAQNEKE